MWLLPNAVSVISCNKIKFDNFFKMKIQRGLLNSFIVGARDHWTYYVPGRSLNGPPWNPRPAVPWSLTEASALDHSKGLNPNCPDLDIAETCEVDCEVVHLQCLTSCENQDSSCISKCTRDFAACVDVCPCYTDCPNGCPCPSSSDYCPVLGSDFH